VFSFVIQLTLCEGKFCNMEDSTLKFRTLYSAFILTAIVINLTGHT